MGGWVVDRETLTQMMLISPLSLDRPYQQQVRFMSHILQHLLVVCDVQRLHSCDVLFITGTSQSSINEGKKRPSPPPPRQSL